MIAQDFCRQRVPATESIAVAMIEGQIVRTDNLHGASRPQGCAQDGRNEHVPAGGKKTSEGASSAVCNGNIVRLLP